MMYKKNILLIISLCLFLLPGCGASPSKKVNPITRLPKQTLAVPKNGPMPIFGSHEFNRIKDEGPDQDIDVSKVPDATPQAEPLARFGNKTPYKVLGETYHVLNDSAGFTQTGTASWYGRKFHGLKTSSGERYDMYKMSAAHRELPLPTYARVTNVKNNKTVIVKINDRGPFHSERVMDLSYAAAARLDIIKSGTAEIKIEAIDPSQYTAESLKDSRTETPTTKTNATTEPLALSASSKEQKTTISSNGKKGFFIQVAAFSREDNVLAMAEQLAKEYNLQTDIDGKVKGDSFLYLLYFGPFPHREEAASKLKSLRLPSSMKPFITER
jgi:rare lipoprotein A